VDVSHAKRAVGVALVGVAGWLVGVDVAAVAAGGVLALALASTDRGAAGLAAASLGVAVATLLFAAAAADASSILFFVTTLAVTVGVAGGVRAAVGGRAGGLVAGWAATALIVAAALAPLAARPDPVVSLLGARLATTPVGWLLLLAPLAIAAAAGRVAISRWRAADLPAGYATAVPPGAVVGAGLVAGIGPPDPRLLASRPDPGLAVLLWAGTVAVVAAAVAATAAADDHRFRRAGAWLATALGPVALFVVVLVDGGLFVNALVAAVPGAAVVVGAAIETGRPPVVAALAGMTFVAVVGAAGAAPTLWPRGRRLLEGRAAEVAVAGLLVAVATKPPGRYEVAVAGGVSVVAWLYVVDRPRLPPPPRTVLERTGQVTIAAAAGALFAARGVQLFPRPDPGLGGLLLLAGVTLMGVAIAE
jgi:hypothetical protein